MAKQPKAAKVAIDVRSKPKPTTANTIGTTTAVRSARRRISRWGSWTTKTRPRTGGMLRGRPVPPGERAPGPVESIAGSGRLGLPRPVLLAPCQIIRIRIY